MLNGPANWMTGFVVGVVLAACFPFSRSHGEEADVQKRMREQEERAKKDNEHQFAEYPKNKTLWRFGSYRRDLENFKKAVGRYPTSREGLRAIVEPPAGLPYKPYGVDMKAYYSKGFEAEDPSQPEYMRTPKGPFDPRDGWSKKIRYSSDGKTYRIEASHGLVFTDKDPDPPEQPCIDCSK